jgi:hypothetical protein
VKEQELFSAFLIAAPSVNAGEVQIVANEEIPERCRKLPLFKACNTNFETGVKTWFLWDGERYVKVGRLAPVHYDLPMTTLMPLNRLVDRIKSGWRPRDEVADASTNIKAVTHDRG